MTRGWRLETDCGPWVQFVQDRFEPHEKMPPICADGYASGVEFEKLQSKFARQALNELRAAQEWRMA